MAITPINKLFNQSSIRFAEVDGELLIAASDVMRSLGYAQPKDAWQRMKVVIENLLDTPLVSIPTLTSKGTHPMTYLNQQQLIAVFLKSEKAAAKPFFQWAVKTLEKEIEAKVAEAPTHRTEEAIQNQLNFLAGFFENKLVFERAELDPFAGNRVDGKPKIRRYDITEKLPKLFRIYELKKGVITESEISSTLNSKAYAEIAATHYPNRVIDIIFVGTSLDESGQRYLERNGAEDSYREFNVSGVTYRAKVRFISISDLAEKWIQKVYDSRPISDRWFITQNVLPKLSFLIDDQVKVLYEAKYPTYQMLSEGKASKVVPFSKPKKKAA